MCDTLSQPVQGTPGGAARETLTYGGNAAKVVENHRRDGVMTDAELPAPRTVVPIEPSLLLATAFDQAQVTGLRHSVTSCAHGSGLSGQRLDDFVLAVNELITNAVRHGGGQGWLRLWERNGELVCEVADHGPGISERRLRDRERPDTAEFAIVIADAFQGIGLGGALAEQLAEAAIERGVRRFSATVLHENVAIRALLERISDRLAEARWSDGAGELLYELSAA